MQENSDQKIFDQIIKHTELKSKKVLEIGCGAGRISSFLSKETSQLIAIDPDDNAIKKAKRTIQGVDFRVGSGELLNYPDSFFDTVIFTLSLHHHPNSKKALSEAKRVLGQNGIIIVVEPVRDGELEQVFAFVHNENTETLNAQNSIKNSDLSVIALDVFSSEWVFEDEDDLFQSLFGYYNMPISSNATDNITNFLGKKIKSKPIILKDKLIIQSLSQYNNAVEFIPN